MEKMQTHQAGGGGGGGDEQQICRRNSVKFGKCKNVSGDNSYGFCDFHYIILPDILTNCINSEEIEPPPDEERCCQSNARWRCKNFRMGQGDDDDSSVPKRRYCEKHYNYFVNKYRNLKSADGLCAKSKTRKKKTKKVTEEEDDVTGNQPPNENPCFSLDMNLPPDEQRCYRRSRTWRCKNFNMGHVRFCQKHYDDRANYLLKMTSGDRTEGARSSATRNSNCSKWRNKLAEENDGTEIQPPTSDTIVGGGFANIGPGEVESLTGIRESVVELEYYKSKCVELPVVLEKKKMDCTTDETEQAPTDAADIEGGSANVGTKRKNAERAEWSGELDFRDFLIQPSVITSNEMETKKEMEKKKLTTNEQLCCVGTHRWRCKNVRMSYGAAAHDASVPKTKFCEKHYNYYAEAYKKKKLLKKQRSGDSDADGAAGPIMRKRKTGKRTEGCGEPESLTKARESMVEFGSMENYKCKSFEFSLQIEKRKLERVKLPGILLREVETRENAAEVEPEEWNKCSEDSAAKISEDSDSSIDSEGSLGTLVDMMAMKYRNRNKDKKIKWKFESDMLSSFEEEPLLCMKAVCALYRQHISEISANGLFHYSDACRCTCLAKFLMAGACNGDLNKSVKELEMFDSKGVEDCKRLATIYSKQLFSIYQSRKDPYFLPPTTVIHGDEIAK